MMNGKVLCKLFVTERRSINPRTAETTLKQGLGLHEEMETIVVSLCDAVRGALDSACRIG